MNIVVTGGGGFLGAELFNCSWTARIEVSQLWISSK